MANTKKLKGQYMTPDKIVTLILDSIGYKEENVLSKTIMEPSFGDGSFLSNIIQRIILEATKEGKISSEICSIIKKNVFGIEKDPVLYEKALKRLNDLLATYSIDSFDWKENLICGDTLLEYNKFLNKFDYVVGNPPYIRIHNIPKEYKEIIKTFTFTDGMFDLYILFYEMGIKMLNNKGKLGFISPNSFMKNTSQKKFRNYLTENKLISAIYDFKNSKIFTDADTYTCICILNKDIDRDDFSIEYKEYQMYDVVAQNRFTYEYFRDELKNKAWNLNSKEDIAFLEDNKKLPNKIKDIAIVQNGVATNKDSIYIIQIFEDKRLTIPYMRKHTDKKKIVYFKDKDGKIQEIESTILRRCVKESRYEGKMDNTYIIFPYQKTNSSKIFKIENIQNEKTSAVEEKEVEIESGFIPLTETKLQKDFPKAYQYLKSYKDELLTRDMEENSSWFLFARSQGIQNCCYKKIIFKHIIKKDEPQIIAYILDEDIVIYSGIYTTIDINKTISPKHSPKKENNSYIYNEALYNQKLTEIKSIFESNNFAKYCSLIGKDMAGGYISVSTSMIKQFGIKKT